MEVRSSTMPTSISALVDSEEWRRATTIRALSDWMSTEAPGVMETWEGKFDEDGVGDFFAELETPDGGLLSRIRWWDGAHDCAEWSHSITR